EDSVTFKNYLSDSDSYSRDFNFIFADKTASTTELTSLTIQLNGTDGNDVLNGWKGKDRRHSACKADALPTELSALIEKDNNRSLYTLHPLDQGIKRMAQRTGLEPATPGVTGRYS
ncbi:hypothetical protein, partial [Acinetobacter baumannii]|uniref:hypothetical protein n=1 Tax=Acinetobacter baumannii TaxID=470 RepID=UPI003ED96738